MKLIGTTENGNYIVEMTAQEWKEGLAEITRLDGVGPAMYSYRKTIGLTQQQMARQVGISRNYYSMIERGKANYSHVVYGKLLAAMTSD